MERGGRIVITDKKALEACKTIAEYCAQRSCCQRCIFRKHKPDRWECHVYAMNMAEILSNIEAKKRGGL